MADVFTVLAKDHEARQTALTRPAPGGQGRK